MFLSRRNFLGTGVAAACAAGLAGCSGSLPVTSSFLQPWRSHLELTPAQWRQRLVDTKALGCSELFLQWSGIFGGSPAEDWSLSDAQMANLFDICAELGMGVHLGLPYDERWWRQISLANPEGPAAFLAHITRHAERHMALSVWPARAAFLGWYIPYELEQYHWADVDRQALLEPALQSMSRMAVARSGSPPTISTYFSRLQTPGNLAQLWNALLDRVALHPMIQDGVGAAGMGNFKALEPLRQMLLNRNAPFDLIVELFEELPSNPDGSDFQARAADAERVRQQWAVARDYGAQRIVAFAVDPWVLGDVPGAPELLRQWRKALT